MAPWRSPQARAIHRNRSRPDSRYLQLATIGLEGYPANRTVVFRGFCEGDRLMIISDTRSAKIDQIQTCTSAEACWYFAKTREQFRIRGDLSVITADCQDPALRNLRVQLWQNLSDAARQQFMWPAPGKVRQSSDFSTAQPDNQDPLPHFCLVLLKPSHVDHLSLRGTPQDRVIYTYTAEGDWQVQPVNP